MHRRGGRGPAVLAEKVATALGDVRGESADRRSWPGCGRPTVEAHRSSTRPSLSTGEPCSFRDSNPNAPSTCQTRVVTDSPGKSGAEKRTAIRFTVPRVVDARRLQNGPSCERHRAQPVHDPTRKADLLRERVIEVDREVVARGRRIPDRLIVRNAVRDFGERVAIHLEAVVRRPLADAALGRHPAEELRHVVLVHELAVLAARVRLDDERRPVRAREERDRRCTGDERHPDSDGPVQEHCLARSGRRSAGCRPTRPTAMPARWSSRRGRSRRQARLGRRPSPLRTRASPPW